MLKPTLWPQFNAHDAPMQLHLQMIAVFAVKALEVLTGYGDTMAIVNLADPSFLHRLTISFCLP